jgi:hypothetical protein
VLDAPSFEALEQISKSLKLPVRELLDFRTVSGKSI